MNSYSLPKLVVFLISFGSLLGQLSAQDKAPELLTNYLPFDKVVKGNIIAVVPPEEMKVYSDKMKAAAIEKKEWYEEYALKSEPGVPLPYHENLGLTQDEYDEYQRLWKLRKHKILQPIELRLEALGERWMIRFAAKNMNLTLLRYDAKEDVFEGIGGKMNRLKDIKSHPETILGDWSGQEWKFVKESLLGVTKEQFAIGKEKDGKHGLIIYRFQNATRQGKFLAYENLLIRFPIEESK